ncbi:Sec23-binding domain of Sec16-domain-containing protein [Amylocystis lapponica]|nr:Sec23-binding domain of Sec16-domain-containing protein [Amylocystis lapponica]
MAGNGDPRAGWNGSVGHAATQPSQYPLEATYPGTNLVSPPLHATSIEGVSLPPTTRTDRAWTAPSVYSNGAVLDGPPRRDSPLAASPASIVSANNLSGAAKAGPYESHRSPERTKSPWEAVSRPASAAYAPSGNNGVSMYDPPITNSRSPGRTKSPGEASVHSFRGVSTKSLHSPPGSEWSPSVPASTPLVPSGSGSVYSPMSSSYEPPVMMDAKRTASPAPSVQSLTGSVSAPYDDYAPTSKATQATHPHIRSMSNGSAFSLSSAPRESPYAPSRHSRQQPSETSSQGSISSLYEKSPPAHEAYAARPTTTFDRTGGQILTLAPAIPLAYAPSPSLLGTNDPLGRTSVRIPVISFGFGGKLVTCFHGSSALNTGFDVALSSRPSTDVKLHVLHKVIPESTLETSAASFPGPLFSDPGTPSTSIVRTGTATQTKTKKARVIKYLKERADEISRGLGYFHSDSVDGRRAEAKHILVLLLKVMVENDGRLSGSTEIDAAVRAALVPRLGLQKTSPDLLRSASSLSISHTAEHAPLSDLPSTASYPVLGSSIQDSHDLPVAVHTVRASHLDKIQDFLLRGDRREACHYASDEKLWAHAMVIASSIDKAAWKEVVTEFVRTELVAKDPRNSPVMTRGEESKYVPSNGREALRVAYSHYAGQGPAAVQELLPPKPLTAHIGAQTLQLPSPSTSSVTPISPNFTSLAETMDIPPEVLARWADTAAMIVSSPMTMETSSTLTALGDQLAGNRWFEAAHACYLLAPQTSPMGGVGSASRLVLIGSPSPSTLPTFARDQDPFILSEIAEFALSLATPAKGQDAFAGLPHLQPYRLIRAAWLAEMGHMQLANRYCDAISNSLGRNSPYINSTFVEQLKGLSDRLIAAPQLDKSGSWIGSKMSKPSLDSIGTWLEGRFTKFIAGDADSPLRGPEDTAATPHQLAFSGPFTHYSTISSGASSAIPSPRQSKTDLTETSISPPPFRAGSAAAMGSSPASQVQINRASSAMDYTRAYDRKTSPIPRVSSASATTSTFSDASLYSQALNGHAFGSNSKQRIEEVDVNEDSDAESAMQPQGPRIASWWGSPESDAPTPTASSFIRVGDAESTQSSDFISLMDDPSLSVTPVASRTPSVDNHRSAQPSFGDDDDDDLGLGNSSSRAKHNTSMDEPATTHTNGTAKKDEKPDEAPQKPDLLTIFSELKTSASGSWFKRIWTRDSTPAPVKANLGEQTSFYYDKELKRWVNKSSGNEAAAPSAPAPPPRAQTASPGRSYGSMPAGTSPHPPPARPSTAIDLTQPPRKPPMRVRSNLAPPEPEHNITSAPPTPLSATIPLTPGEGPPPPAGGRKATAGKRAVRSRYVDVFQQEASQGGTS